MVTRPKNSVKRKPQELNFPDLSPDGECTKTIEETGLIIRRVKRDRRASIMGTHHSVPARTAYVDGRDVDVHDLTLSKYKKMRASVEKTRYVANKGDPNATFRYSKWFSSASYDVTIAVKTPHKGDKNGYRMYSWKKSATSAWRNDVDDGAVGWEFHEFQSMTDRRAANAVPLSPTPTPKGRNAVPLSPNARGLYPATGATPVVLMTGNVLLGVRFRSGTYSSYLNASIHDSLFQIEAFFDTASTSSSIGKGIKIAVRSVTYPCVYMTIDDPSKYNPIDFKQFHCGDHLPIEYLFRLYEGQSQSPGNVLANAILYWMKDRSVVKIAGGTRITMAHPASLSRNDFTLRRI